MSISAVKRVGISIPGPILKELQALVPERKRSEYIVRALREKLEDEKARKLRDKLIAGYKANSAADAELAEEADELMGVRESKIPYGGKPRGSSNKEVKSTTLPLTLPLAWKSRRPFQP